MSFKLLTVPQIHDKFKNTIEVSAMKRKKQIMYALVDLELHSLEEISVETINETVKRIHKEIMGIDITPGTNYVSIFGHLCGGYESQYYTYQWSQYWADQLFEKYLFDTNKEKSLFDTDNKVSLKKGLFSNNFVKGKNIIDNIKGWVN